MPTVGDRLPAFAGRLVLRPRDAISSWEERSTMTIDAISGSLPVHAKHLKLNLFSLLNDQVLSAQQRWRSLRATALASRNAALIAAVSAEAAQQAIRSAPVLHAVAATHDSETSLAA